MSLDHMELWRQRVRASLIRNIVEYALDILTMGQDSPAYVWLVLTDTRIRGCGQQTLCCPVTRFLQNAVRLGIVECYDDRWRVVMDDNSVVVGPLPYAIREFIRMFDNGDFPSLIDYNHRHGRLIKS